MKHEENFCSLFQQVITVNNFLTFFAETKHKSEIPRKKKLVPNNSVQKNLLDALQFINHKNNSPYQNPRVYSKAVPVNMQHTSGLVAKKIDVHSNGWRHFQLRCSPLFLII